MNRRRNIIRFGQEDQSDMADSVDAAEDRDSTADTYGESVRSDGGQYDLTTKRAAHITAGGYVLWKCRCP